MSRGDIAYWLQVLDSKVYVAVLNFVDVLWQTQAPQDVARVTRSTSEKTCIQIDRARSSVVVHLAKVVQQDTYSKRH